MGPVFDREFRGLGSLSNMNALRRALKTADVSKGEIAWAIENSDFNLTERGFTMLIASCKRCRLWKKASEIFNVMKGETIRKRGIEPNFYTYTSLISVLCVSGACPQAMKMLMEMRVAAKNNPKLRPDSEVYHVLVEACARANRRADVCRLHDMMVQDGVSRTSIPTLLSILEASSEMGCWGSALRILDELHSLQVDLSWRVYSGVLMSCAKKGAVGPAIEVFLGMQMAGTSPNQTTFHHVLQAAIAARDAYTSFELLNCMQDECITIRPTVYSGLLVMLRDEGLWKAEEQLLAKMEAEGLGAQTRSVDLALSQASA